MGKILMALIGILLVYPAIYVSNTLRDWATTNLTLDVYGEFFFGILPFVLIGVFVFGVFKAASHLGKGKGEE
jgi:large-conductance mechanosensitive channel